LLLLLVIFSVVGGLVGYQQLSKPAAPVIEQISGTWLLGSLHFEFDFANQRLSGFPVGADQPSKLILVEANPHRAVVLINGQRTNLTLQCDARALLVELEDTIPEILLRPGVMLTNTQTCT
jgi:hypothetical protein